ncbi:response regulator [Paenibacillus sp. SYP-B3998]|uniref:Response regulator n=1 Tax=Paenibacillus sp. SYP-B3998 TaxID=2678564 RepID=A0A6G3ZRB5_9BACL|nr:response regulator [Paenibacillus sp. SYP-B3998]NEW04578.1 response regulator [Paenibacillus sp. SYP-B3998]
MFKVMLVDDDVPMMKYVTKLIDWSALQLTLVGSASSGVKALALFHEHRPDLVITDIGMPQMDGIELAAELQKLKPDVKIMFLTCHEEFHYARKAVQLDAEDYLIKDELTTQQLESALLKTIQALTSDKERFEELTYKQDMLKHRETWKAQFWSELLSGVSVASIHSQSARLGIAWKRPHFMLAIGDIQYGSFPQKYRYNDVPLLLYAISNICDELPLDGFSLVTLTDKETRLVCIANYQHDLTRNAVEDVHKHLTLLQQNIAEYLKIDISFRFGMPFKEVENIQHQYRSLMQRERWMFYEQMNNVQPRIVESRIWNHDIMGVLGGDWQRLEEAVKGGNELLLAESLNALQAKAETLRLDPDELLLKSSQWMRHMELQHNQPSLDAFHRCLLHCGRWEQAMQLLRSGMRSLLGSATDAWIEKKPKLQLIDQYISDHLSENISLVDIANYLFLNPSYFSRYFKQESGLNFTDYMHRYKMKIACKLLKEKQHSTEIIAMKLGYMERTYFSKVFKKYVGVSPKDYR